MKKVRKVNLILLVILAFYYIACERPTSPPNPNLPPNTTLANVPRDGDTLFALQTLHWDGEDDDGYVVSYQYRYITYRFPFMDSLVQEWKETKSTSLTIAFVSDSSLNKQVFQVRSVDNDGAVDPTPAEKVFYTRKNRYPVTEIFKPTNNQQLFVTDKITDWWPGVELVFAAHDPDEGGDIVEYAWSVDDNYTWNWTKDTSIFITPDRFSQPLTGYHTIRVTSRDNTNLIDDRGDSVRVKLIKPTFSKRILIIDETDENNFPFGVVQPTDKQVDDFYSEIFGTNANWDFKAFGMPPKDTLAQYQLVVWHADNLPFTKNQNHKLPSVIDAIKDYMNIGGKFFMSGWRILKAFAWDDPFPVTFKPGTFVHDYLHINVVDETPIEGDCTSMVGVGELFSDINIDRSKILDFPYYINDSTWGLGQVNIITQPSGFTDKIYTYQNHISSPHWRFRGRACGLRYYGSIFDAVILGFPVYFIKKEDAIVMVNEILRSLNIK